MLTKFARSNIIFRSYLMKYICLAGYMQWSKEKSKFVDPPIYIEWNANYLLVSMAGYPLLLTIHLVERYLTEPDILDTKNSGKFIPYAMGWGENILALSVLAMGIWIQTRNKYINEIINQFSVYDAPLARIYCENGQLPPLIRQCDRIVLLISVLCIVIPFSFVSVLTLDSDETHNLIKEWLEIDIKWEWKNAPFLIFMAWGATTASSIMFYRILVGTLYMTSILVNLNNLEPTAITVDRNSANSKGQICHLVRTRGIGTLTEEAYIRFLRCEGVMNRFFNAMEESVLATSHHSIDLALLVLCSFLFIKAHDTLVEAGVLVLIMFAGGVAIPILIEYVEATRVGQICDASQTVLSKTREYSRKGSHLHKFIAGCRVLRLNTGYPFYNVDKYTFLEFMDEAANFIFTLLAF